MMQRKRNKKKEHKINNQITMPLVLGNYGKVLFLARSGNSHYIASKTEEIEKKGGSVKEFLTIPHNSPESILTAVKKGNFHTLICDTTNGDLLAVKDLPRYLSDFKAKIGKRRKL